MRSARPREIACQQVLIDESSVFSAQWMIIPGAYAATVTPRFLLDRYLKYIRRATLSLIRPATTSGGIEFRFLTTGITLLSFTMPEPSADGCILTLAIRGGFLVQPDQCRRGELQFVVEPAGTDLKIMLNLADYCPMLLGGRRPSKLRRWLYRLTQAFIHKKVTISFLARIYREIAGAGACTTVVRVTPRAGREI